MEYPVDPEARRLARIKWHLQSSRREESVLSIIDFKSGLPGMPCQTYLRLEKVQAKAAVSATMV